MSPMRWYSTGGGTKLDASASSSSMSTCHECASDQHRELRIRSRSNLWQRGKGASPAQNCTSNQPTRLLIGVSLDASEMTRSLDQPNNSFDVTVCMSTWNIEVSKYIIVNQARWRRGSRSNVLLHIPRGGHEPPQCAEWMAQGLAMPGGKHSLHFPADLSATRTSNAR